jgi:hypothetical protein
MVRGVSTRRSTPNHIDRVRGSIPFRHDHLQQLTGDGARSISLDKSMVIIEEMGQWLTQKNTKL